MWGVVTLRVGCGGIEGLGDWEIRDWRLILGKAGGLGDWVGRGVWGVDGNGRFPITSSLTHRISNLQSPISIEFIQRKRPLFRQHGLNWPIGHLLRHDEDVGSLFGEGFLKKRP